MFHLPHCMGGKSKYAMIFAELVSTGQRNAETELNRLVWATQSLQEESAACVLSLLPLLQTQMGKTGGGGRSSEEKVGDRRSEIWHNANSVVIGS